MPVGQYRIEQRNAHAPPDSRWICIPSNMELGEEFAKGAFHYIKQLSGGNQHYRLVKGHGANQTVVDVHATREVRPSNTDDELPAKHIEVKVTPRIAQDDFQITLVIDNQSFVLAYTNGNQRSAEWFAGQLEGALLGTGANINITHKPE